MSTAAGALEADSKGDSAPSPHTSPQQQKRPKSPPLAFEPTPNDALVAFPPQSSQDGASSPRGSTMGRMSPRSNLEELQMIVDQQAEALQLLHDGFAAERKIWMYERERFLQRIASLEKLLKTGNGYSPAKSPVTSPTVDTIDTVESYRSPSLRNDHRNFRLPSIAEDDSTLSLAERRGVAPTSLDLPDVQTPETIRRGAGRNGSVSFGEPTPEAPIKVEEIPVAPHHTGKNLSPPPLEYRENAGHTPLAAPPRPRTPPPKKFTDGVDGIDDTPTRRNTAINNFLTRATEEDEDPELKGPLNMPELPHMPSESNFTMEMLSKKLAQIEKHPERNKPGVFSAPSPGLASPEDEIPSLDSHLSPSKFENTTSGAIAPVSTQQQTASHVSSQARSPNSGNPMSPNMAPLTQSESQESKIEEQFRQGGIKLKKKPSTNFGAPFGQLSFTGTRRPSELDALNG